MGTANDNEQSKTTAADLVHCMHQSTIWHSTATVGTLRYGSTRICCHCGYAEHHVVESPYNLHWLQ